MKRIQLGSNAQVADDARLAVAFDEHEAPTVVGDGATIRRGATIYADVEIGDGFTTGHNAVIREGSRLGDDVLVGTNATIDGQSEIGSHVSLQTGAYVPARTSLGDEVFVGPNAVLTNDRYPIRAADELEGPTIDDDVSIGANATVLPGVTVGTGSFVAAGSVVIDDVPADTLAVGTPADHRELPPVLRGGNQLA